MEKRLNKEITKTNNQIKEYPNILEARLRADGTKIYRSE